MLLGMVEVLRDGPEHRAAKRLLARKYPQYKAFCNDSFNVVMKLTPTKGTNLGLWSREVRSACSAGFFRF